MHRVQESAVKQTNESNTCSSMHKEYVWLRERLDLALCFLVDL